MQLKKLKIQRLRGDIPYPYKFFAFYENKQGRKILLGD